MSDKQTLQSQITQLEKTLANPKTEGRTKELLQVGLKKAKAKLEELEKAEKLENSKKELTPKQEKQVEETKSEAKSLAKALKDKMAKVKTKVTKTKATTKKGGARSVSKAKELAKEMRSKQKKQSVADKDIESDANRYAINTTKRTSKGGRANQYGTKSENKGGTYYEKRENRYDRQNKRYAKLEGGGSTEGKNGYVAFYKGKRIEVYADTMYQAQKKAAEIFKAKKSYEVNVALAEVDGKQYVHNAYKSGGSLEDKYTFFGTSENGWYVKDKDTNKFIKPMGKMVWESKEEAIEDLKKDKFKYADGGMMAKGGQVSGYFIFQPYEKQGNYFISTTFKGVSPNSVIIRGLEGKLKGNDINSAEQIAHSIMQEHPYIAKLDIVKRGANVLKSKRVASFVRDDESGEYQIQYYADGGTIDIGGTQFSNEDLSGLSDWDVSSGGFYAKGGGVPSGVEMSKFRRNIMGTLSFDLKIGSMRKAQDFVVYPVSKGDDSIMIQSDTRIGRINMSNGMGKMSQSHSSGAYGVHLSMDKLIPFQLEPSQLLELKEELAKTAGKNVGSSVIKTDNEGAADFMAKGGNVNRGGAWTRDHYQYNKSESYEIPTKDRKYTHGGTMNQGTRFHSSAMKYDDGGMVQKLEGKMVRVNFLGGGSDTFVIDSASITPPYYVHREVSLYTKSGTVDKFPLDKLNDFTSGKEVRVLDSKGQPYMIQLMGRLENGGTTDIGGTKFSTDDLSGMFEKGGGVEKGNLDMVKNQVIQVEHHAKELMQTLKSNPQVDAWVVAKMDRATSNLSDITHYLEGEQNSFADGGMMAKGGEIKSIGEAITEHYGVEKKDGISRGEIEEVLMKEKNKLLKYNGRFAKNSHSTIEDFNGIISDLKKDGWVIYDKYGMGGKTTFKDKENAIAKSLMKRKKVSPSVQKDYGKTYSKDEAIDSAKRIVGAMRKKEMTKKKR